MVHCPNCKSTNYRCKDTRPQGIVRIRKYECNNCGVQFKTIERVFAIKMFDDSWVEVNGEKEK